MSDILDDTFLPLTTSPLVSLYFIKNQLTRVPSKSNYLANLAPSYSMVTQ